MERNAIQSVERAAAILRTVASAGSDGARVKDLATALGLIPSTVNRLCKTMVKEGWLIQPAGQRRYFVGGALANLSTMATDRSALSYLGELAAARLAESTGDTIYFFVREGIDLNCCYRREGDFAIRTLPVDVGSWIPLGLGYAGIAALAAFQETECETVLGQLVHARPAVRSLDQRKLRRDVERARRIGYADSLREGRLPPSAGGIAASVMSPHGEPLAAISLLAINERLTPDRVTDLAQAIVAECAQIARVLAETESTVNPTDWSAVTADQDHTHPGG